MHPMTLTQQRHSSSTFIAHLLVQEYPPKVQPQSSSARDHAFFGHLDKVDTEAGCILIALANHDKRKDMNDLIPYSVRVIDYNQTTPSNSTLDISSSSSSSTTSSSSSSSSSDSVSSASPHTNNEDPITTSMTAEKLESSGTMSIKNLIGMDGKPISSSVTGALAGMTDPPSNTDQSSTITKMPPTAASSLTSSQNCDINDQPKAQSTWKRKPKTDPILLLAAAAKAIDQDEQLQQRVSQKRKFSDEESSMDSRSHSSRPRHHVDSAAAFDHQRQPEKSKFSYQYLSMKQNPKIKRNAMHAYITYMIYTDLASSDKTCLQEKDTHHHNTITTTTTPPPAPPLSSSSSSTQATSSYPLPASSYPTLTETSQRTGIGLPTSITSSSSSSSPLPMTFDQHPYAQHSSYSSRINTAATGSTGMNASSSETGWPYGLASLPPPPSSSSLSSSPPPPPPPSLPPSIHSGPMNRAAGNSSIMARPLTAFLRNDMYT